MEFGSTGCARFAPVRGVFFQAGVLSGRLALPVKQAVEKLATVIPKGWVRPRNLIFLRVARIAEKQIPRFARDDNKRTSSATYTAKRIAKAKHQRATEKLKTLSF
jgi:hypothetical protein